jgi:hypothetical protein
MARQRTSCYTVFRFRFDVVACWIEGRIELEELLNRNSVIAELATSQPSRNQASIDKGSDLSIGPGMEHV